MQGGKLHITEQRTKSSPVIGLVVSKSGDPQVVRIEQPDALRASPEHSVLQCNEIQPQGPKSQILAPIIHRSPSFSLVLSPPNHAGE